MRTGPVQHTGRRGRTPSVTDPRALPSARRASAALLLGAVLCATLAVPGAVHAQDNYEIQVYGSDLVPSGVTMMELHSNFTFRGSTTSADGLLPTNHALHETVEITHGFSDWLEVGFYIFTSARDGNGWDWVGDHIRPRISIPAKWHWPIGLSLSQEIGYQRRAYSPDTWTWEIRPIVDQQLGRWYWSVNPALERSLRGEGTGNGFEFAPNAQVTFAVTPKVTGALEYYGSFGPLRRFDPLSETEQQIFPAVNLDLGPEWEFNAGVGFGLTNATDHLLVKMILGYRLGRPPKN